MGGLAASPRNDGLASNSDEGLRGERDSFPTPGNPGERYIFDHIDSPSTQSLGYDNVYVNPYLSFMEGVVSPSSMFKVPREMKSSIPTDRPHNLYQNDMFVNEGMECNISNSQSW